VDLSRTERRENRQEFIKLVPIASGSVSFYDKSAERRNQIWEPTRERDRNLFVMTPLRTSKRRAETWIGPIDAPEQKSAMENMPVPWIARFIALVDFRGGNFRPVADSS
jgi:hypothetical protein